MPSETDNLKWEAQDKDPLTAALKTHVQTKMRTQHVERRISCKPQLKYVKQRTLVFLMPTSLYFEASTSGEKQHILNQNLLGTILDPKI